MTEKRNFFLNLFVYNPTTALYINAQQEYINNDKTCTKKDFLISLFKLSLKRANFKVFCFLAKHTIIPNNDENKPIFFDFFKKEKFDINDSLFIKEFLNFCIKKERGSILKSSDEIKFDFLDDLINADLDKSEKYILIPLCAKAYKMSKVKIARYFLKTLNNISDLDILNSFLKEWFLEQNLKIPDNYINYVLRYNENKQIEIKNDIILFFINNLGDGVTFNFEESNDGINDSTPVQNLLLSNILFDFKESNDGINDSTPVQNLLLSNILLNHPNTVLKYLDAIRDTVIYPDKKNYTELYCQITTFNQKKPLDIFIEKVTKSLNIDSEKVDENEYNYNKEVLYKIYLLFLDQNCTTSKEIQNPFDEKFLDYLEKKTKDKEEESLKNNTDFCYLNSNFEVFLNYLYAQNSDLLSLAEKCVEFENYAFLDIFFHLLDEAQQQNIRNKISMRNNINLDIIVNIDDEDINLDNYLFLIDDKKLPIF